MNPKDKIEELFTSIESSEEYKSYLNIKKIIENNEEINELVNTIKRFLEVFEGVGCHQRMKRAWANVSRLLL